MDLILVGPGRAGLALSLSLVGGGHTIVGVLARDPAAAASAAERLGSQPLQWGEVSWQWSGRAATSVREIRPSFGS